MNNFTNLYKSIQEAFEPAGGKYTSYNIQKLRTDVYSRLRKVRQRIIDKLDYDMRFFVYSNDSYDTVDISDQQGYDTALKAKFHSGDTKGFSKSDQGKRAIDFSIRFKRPYIKLLKREMTTAEIRKTFQPFFNVAFPKNKFKVVIFSFYVRIVPLINIDDYITDYNDKHAIDFVNKYQRITDDAYTEILSPFNLEVDDLHLMISDCKKESNKVKKEIINKYPDIKPYIKNWNPQIYVQTHRNAKLSFDIDLPYRSVKGRNPEDVFYENMAFSFAREKLGSYVQDRCGSVGAVVQIPPFNVPLRNGRNYTENGRIRVTFDASDKMGY